MPDYKAMCQKLFYAAEEAISLLIRAQQECEELYLREEGAEGRLLLLKKEEHSSDEE